MNTGLESLYITRFSTKLELKLQQMGSMLRGTVEEGMFAGAKIASPVQQLGAVSSQAPAGRFSPLNVVPNDYTRRWISPIDRELPQLVDTFDMLKTDIDVKGQLVAGAAKAFGRDWDDEIIRAATATAQIGVDAGSLSNETFNTTNFRVAVDFKAAAATGLTTAKLIEAKRIFRKYHNDLDNDELTLVIGSNQEADLLSQVQVTSTEFNGSEKPVLKDGKVIRFLGFNIKVMERLPLPVTDQRGVLAYTKSGIHLGVWQDLQTQISQRMDLSSQPWQIYSKQSYGATRTQPGKVVQILCSDTSGVDITN